MARIAALPVWAGVAIRLSDGTLYAFELTGPDLQAMIKIEHEMEDAYTNFAYHDFIPTGRSRVDIQVQGSARNWSGFRQTTPATPEEIEPAVKALEAGR